MRPKGLTALLQKASVRISAQAELSLSSESAQICPLAGKKSSPIGFHLAAFTLLELLVVVAIVLVLAGLLLPVLTKAKALAQRARCINNEKQLSLVWHLYSSDNSELLPSNGYGVGNLPLWVQGSTHDNPEAFTNQMLLLDPQRALFASYVRNQEIYKCPSDRGAKKPNNALVLKVRSYAVNGYMGWVSPLDSYNRPNYFAFFKSADLSPVSPSSLFVFQDVHPDSLCMPAFVVYMGAENFFHLPASYHRGAGALTFADGHTEIHSWKDSRTVRDNQFVAPHGEASPGNIDLTWLQEHTTQKK